MTGDFDDSLRPVAALGELTARKLAALPPPAARTPAEREAAAETKLERRRVCQRFLRVHAPTVYRRLTRDFQERPRLAELLTGAATEFPGLVPSPEAMAEENGRPQAEKEGLEIDQALFVGEVLRDPASGTHLMNTMLTPTPRALELLPDYLLKGELTLRSVRLRRRDGAAHLTLTREDSLNAEDDEQVDDVETAVDLALLDPEVRVGVFRGGEMTHPKYAGRRVFSAGVNLKALHAGRLSWADFFMRRELGYLNKIVRGTAVDHDGSWRGPNIEKPWLAAVDSFAIGGGAQLLLLFDHVLAASDSFFSLPAAQEGIIPGAGNFRLTRAVGQRRARRIILMGDRVAATSPDAGLLFDDVVGPGELDEAVERGVRALDSPAVTSNRRMLNLADEPLEACRLYFAEFALQQALRLYSEDVLGKVSRFAAHG
ncbi:(3,5-dihydroxyphenyl)acetyl-CoA 1,2-dioxygenase DpgC [Streptomyces sp. Tu6071]|uniref:(3,5-dihydroxyphenyl)acetyl-CoA 1,2-dioxygenase DpgC n=1 Tax=Streptomyces sp. Tu6071 TaxID=355249 RepID=UPI0002EE7898|nr:(3,5-dihydroxyphenyl)acetyl-CoA 1,2-dioxygenase DpgC [Streptomyces sp. Tu6071]